MKVKELIEYLKLMNQETPVVLEDWQEQYEKPAEAEWVRGGQGQYSKAGKNGGRDKELIGPYVCIGVVE